MPSDAKLGLVLGVAVVIAVAVVFFRKGPAETNPAATSVRSAPGAPARPAPRPAIARASGRTAETPAAPAVRRHTTQPGDTLFSLAQHYYGDGTRFALISRVNGQEVEAAEPLPPGTVLIIPEAETEEAAESR
jgi:nucleoid-associated protein YgaU